MQVSRDGVSQMTLYHASTISDEIRNKLYHIVRNVEFTYTRHALEQRASKGVCGWERIAREGYLIEFNVDEENLHHKVLLRTNDGHCAVFALRGARVVTMWWNHPDDNHATIDASKYEWGVRAD